MAPQDPSTKFITLRTTKYTDEFVGRNPCHHHIKVVLDHIQIQYKGASWFISYHWNWVKFIVILFTRVEQDHTPSSFSLALSKIDHTSSSFSLGLSKIDHTSSSFSLGLSKIIHVIKFIRHLHLARWFVNLIYIVPSYQRLVCKPTCSDCSPYQRLCW